MRTRLANERTLLAYTRTAIMLAATGGTLLALDSPRWGPQAIAWGAIGAGVAVLAAGLVRFERVGRSLRASGENLSRQIDLP